MLESELSFLQGLREAIDKYLFLGFAPSGRTPGGVDPASEEMSAALQKSEFQTLRQRISEAKPRAKSIMAKYGIAPVLEQHAPPIIGGGLIARQHILDVVTDNMTWQRVEKVMILDPIDQAIGAIKQGTSPRDDVVEEPAFDPWGPISSILFEFDSDRLVQILGMVGLIPDLSLTAEQSYSNATRNRVYRPRVDSAYKKLNAEGQRRLILNVAREIGRRDSQKRERLNEALQRIGWVLSEESLIPTHLINPKEMEAVPEVARRDLVKAIDRLLDDPTGAISAACGTIDSLTAAIYQTHSLGDPGKASFQQKVNRSLDALGALAQLQKEVEGLGWERQKAKEFCHNLKGAISHAAKVMEILRSQMGDVHGSKPTLDVLAFDSIRWAMIICSLLGTDGRGTVTGS